MFALESVGFSTLDLQVEERSQAAHLLLHALQTYHTLELLQAFGVIHLLRCFVRNVGLNDRHQLLVAHLLQLAILQAAGLILANLVEQRPHRPTIGKVLVALLMHLLDHLLSQGFCLRRKHIFLRLCEYFHNLEELIRRIVVDIEEIVETATHTRIDAEEIIHLRTVSGSDDHELAAIVLHTLHQRFQSLHTLIVAFAALAQGCQRVGLVDEEYTTHRLVAKSVHHLRRLALIGAHHLRAVHLDHVS